MRVGKRFARLRQTGLRLPEIGALLIQLRLKVGHVLLHHHRAPMHGISLAVVDKTDFARQFRADRDIVLRAQRARHLLRLRNRAGSGGHNADLRGCGRGGFHSRALRVRFGRVAARFAASRQADSRRLRLKFEIARARTRLYESFMCEFFGLYVSE